MIWSKRGNKARVVGAVKGKAKSDSKGYEIAKIVIPLLIGFVLGQVAENLKDQKTEFKLDQENRIKVYQATASSFPDYVVQWQRLTLISETERKFQKHHEDMIFDLENLKSKPQASTTSRRAIFEKQHKIQHSKETLQWISEQKKIYVADRNKAISTLLASLEQAKLFFGDKVVAAISQFDQFDAQTQQGDASSNKQRLSHGREILTQMKEEISREQKANRRSWYLIF